MSVQENLPPTKDSFDIQVVRYDDVPVKAGENFNFILVFNTIPNYPGSILYTIGPENHPASQTSVSFEAGQRECKGGFGIPPTAPGGTWVFTTLQLWDGFSSRPFASKPRTFQVIPNKNIVFPTSAEVLVNASQQQLLRLEARHVQQRIDALKAAVSEYKAANHSAQIAPLLRSNIEDAIKALDVTETEFAKLATNKDGTAARVFFDDLRQNYQDVSIELVRHSAMSAENRVRLIEVSFEPNSLENRYPLLAQAVLRAFEGNELAYEVAAELGTTFDLKVVSNPPGATVSYYRRGDPPHKNPDTTVTTIPSLPYAVWYIKVEKAGFKAEEREHDAIRTRDHTLVVDLKP